MSGCWVTCAGVTMMRCPWRHGAGAGGSGRKSASLVPLQRVAERANAGCSSGVSCTWVMGSWLQPPLHLQIDRVVFLSASSALRVDRMQNHDRERAKSATMGIDRVVRLQDPRKRGTEISRSEVHRRVPRPGGVVDAASPIFSISFPRSDLTHIYMEPEGWSYETRPL